MKKIGKIVLILVLVLILLWAAMAVTDFIRCGSLKQPLFTVPVETADDGGSGVYRGLGYRVRVRGHLDAEAGFVLEYTEFSVGGHVLSAAIT